MCTVTFLKPAHTTENELKKLQIRDNTLINRTILHHRLIFTLIYNPTNRINSHLY